MHAYESCVGIGRVSYLIIKITQNYNALPLPLTSFKEVSDGNPKLSFIMGTKQRVYCKMKKKKNQLEY